MGKARVLVVEDDDSVRESIKDILAENGYDASVASDGTAGIARVERDSPDLVLLDLKLPGVDGFEVCRRIRQFSHVPLIAVSGLSPLEDRTRFLDGGGNDYITKPFKPDELRFRIGPICAESGKKARSPNVHHTMTVI